MKYNLYIDGFFWQEIEGNNIESALIQAGMDVDFTLKGNDSGIIHYDDADIIGIARSGGFQDDQELEEYIFANEVQSVVFEWIG